MLGYVVRKVEYSALIVEEKIAIAQNGHQITHSPRNLRCEGLQERYRKLMGENAMQYVYHSSNMEGLTKIMPRKSTHGKEFVYASRYEVISALFLARWNDFLITLLTDICENRVKITLVERYPNAFKEIFDGKSGYIYYLSETNFKQCTDWICEIVSSKEESVHGFRIVPNILSLIKEYEEQGKLELFYYPDRPDTIPKDDSDMLSKAISLYKMSGESYNLDYCIERFPKFREQLLKEKY